MKKLEIITSNVFRKDLVNEKTIMVYYQADLLDIPPFMCSPFSEDLMWANNTNDLIKYIFEVIISNYLINDSMIFGEYIYDEEEEYDFIKACEVYENVKGSSQDRILALKEIKNIYKDYIDKEIQYLDFLKLLVKLEQILPKTAISLKFESFTSPLELRNTKRLLKKTKFNFENLSENF